MLSGCYCTRPYQQRISYIPTNQTKEEPQIWFFNRGVPDKAFFEITEFELKELGSHTRHGVADILKWHARMEGLDAVINVEYWHETESGANLATVIIDILADENEYDSENQIYTSIAGIGIKYLENLDFIDQIPEFEYAYKLDSNSFPNRFFKIEFKLTGDIHDFDPENIYAAEVFTKYIKPYSMHHLLKEREGWSYTLVDGQLFERILRNEDNKIIKDCNLHFNKDGQVTEIDITRNDLPKKPQEFVKIVYNSNGSLSGRIINTCKGATIFEKYEYERGKVIRKTMQINFIENEQVETIELSSSFVYFDKDYLEKYYYEEYVQN